VSISRGKRNLLTRFYLFFPIVVLTACASDVPAAQRSQRSVVDVILTVRNESRLATQVTLTSETARVVLGDLAGGAAQSCSIPSALVGSPSMLRLEAVSDGGTPVKSDSFQVRRGEQVVWSFAGPGHGNLVHR